jgi:hypothetical protein
LYALPLLIGSNVYHRLVTWNPNCCQSFCWLAGAHVMLNKDLPLYMLQHNSFSLRTSLSRIVNVGPLFQIIEAWASHDQLQTLVSPSSLLSKKSFTNPTPGR